MGICTQPHKMPSQLGSVICGAGVANNLPNQPPNRPPGVGGLTPDDTQIHLFQDGFLLDSPGSHLSPRSSEHIAF
jgi:hypothetical protein